MRLSRPAAVLFDLDGTLVDSAPDLTTAVNRSLADIDRPPLTEDQVCAWIGNGARLLVARALAGERDITVEPPATDAAVARFFVHYHDCLCEHSRLYPGVLEGLDQLRAMGLPMGVVTNKPAAFTTPLMEALGIAGYFGVAVSGDTLGVKKPDPAPLIHAAERLGVAIGDCVYVGDSAADRTAAEAAGSPLVRVPYGYPGDDAIFADHSAAMTLTVDQLAAGLATESRKMP
ncbi:phosphoglycolate phosphatase [Spiribacter vilamensis]|uniref:Phosphoglycolate phosphatase n=1 Tax=Spiribacter vilamensis TaxID=531306 RepID=A0A4Q8D1I8_9GAMM|nr:phosphoglycolate phosphatase [Spiribacter vilamensis]RZU99172.1 phosphoglycolate phosphatase [Spiribacter vilamensis]TVO61838.1 phosphoglycolate phosphatase [Spiribacter vilamensis]